MGSHLRYEYTVIGDVVNLAARLMQAAQGGILVDQSSKTEAENIFSFEKPEPILVKGKQQPIVVFVPSRLSDVDAIPETQTRSQSMVGRHREIRTVGLALTKVKQHSRPLVLAIQGEWLLTG